MSAELNDPMLGALEEVLGDLAFEELPSLPVLTIGAAMSIPAVESLILTKVAPDPIRLPDPTDLSLLIERAECVAEGIADQIGLLAACRSASNIVELQELYDFLDMDAVQLIATLAGIGANVVQARIVARRRADERRAAADATPSASEASYGIAKSGAA